MIRDEEKRLRRAIRSLLLLSLGAPAAVLYACSSSSGDGAGGGTDASAQGDGTTGSSGSSGSSSGTSGSSGSSGTSGSSGSSGTSGSSGSSGTSGGTDAGAESSTPVCAEGADAAHPPIDGAVYLEAGDDGSCDYFFEYTACAPFPTVATGNGCYFNLSQCAAICGFTTTTGCFVTNDNCTHIDGGPNTIVDPSIIKVDCTKCLGGRRPEEMESFAKNARGGDELGAWFAELSHLEGASIAAFRTLRAELLAHGAPRELVQMAERSAKDEVRHTRVTARLARKFGATPKLAKVRRGDVRSLEALAIENAAEGCVRETFGALLAAHQAEHAADAEIRAEMATIAEDETRHAALAWAVAEWATSRLDAAGRAKGAAAKARAVEELRREVESETPHALVAMAGLPTAAAARALVDGAARTLWS
jgi:hypothetical protein